MYRLFVVLAVAAMAASNAGAQSVPRDFGFVPGPDGGYPDEYKGVVMVALQKAAGIARVDYSAVIREWDRRYRDVEIFAVLDSMTWRSGKTAANTGSQTLRGVGNGGGILVLSDGSRWAVYPEDRRYTLRWDAGQPVRTARALTPPDGYDALIENSATFDRIFATRLD